MVQPPENLSIVIGHVVERAAHPRLDGWELVTVHVDDTTAAPDRADLLSARRGQDLPVAFRGGLLGDAAPGDRLRFRAELIPDGAMAEPHPDAGDLTILGPAD